MAEDFKSLTKKETWDLRELPPGSHGLSAIKMGLQSKTHLMEILQSRSCPIESTVSCLGFEQLYGIDYGETFALVVGWSTLHADIALAMAQGWPISHIDVVTDFLNNTLQEGIYMVQPHTRIRNDRQKSSGVQASKVSLWSQTIPTSLVPRDGLLP